MEIYRFVAALYASRSVPQFLKECRHVVYKMDGNTYFTYLNLPWSQVNGHLDALEDAEQDTLGGPPGAVAIRNTALLIVRGDMRHLKSGVQMTADADITHAKEIIESSGMQVATRAKIVKSELAVRYPGVPGVARLDARAVKGAAIYQWQIGDQKTWTDMPPTTVASTVATGLTAATIYTFRFRTFGRAGYSEWSAPVTFIAH